jgi:metal-responsive CopG/Arc/MetJ family transcriptional regulator
MGMAKTTVNIGFTVPPSMAEEFERLAREEQSTKSELFRRMFRLYQSYREQSEQSEKKRLERLLQPGQPDGGEQSEPRR